MNYERNGIELGLGLIGIGRSWGYKPSAIPDEKAVSLFLAEALALGIRFFDTAPSYGSSEARLGQFLKALPTQQRHHLTVATKFGEFYNENSSSTYVDHSCQALCRSVDTSLSRLGNIDILQLHKTTPEVLKSSELLHAIDYARQKGITSFGASVSDLESGRIVCKSSIFSTIQIPFNMQNHSLEEILQLAKEQNKYVIINRPFNMGETICTQSTPLPIKEAFAYIIKKGFRGVILTGTKTARHLQENIEGFQQALKNSI